VSQLIIPKPVSGSVTSVNTFTAAVLLSTNNIPEGGNVLYFTNSRASAALSTINTAGNNYHGTSYNPSTGVLTISADYLAATPFTFVLRDGNGGIIANTANFNELNVSDQITCSNSITVPTLNVTNSFNLTGPISASINPLSAGNFTINTQYINGPTTTYISAVLSLSTQTTYLPKGGIKIDPTGGTNYSIIIPVVALGGVYIDVSGYILSGAQIQASAWVPPNASYMFTQISGVTSQTSVAIISGSCQQVYFS
jgi:hypothetical protein